MCVCVLYKDRELLGGTMTTVGPVGSSLSNCLCPCNRRGAGEPGGGPFTRQSLLDLSSVRLLNAVVKGGGGLAGGGT